VVAAAAAATMLGAPFALLHGGAAPAATAAGSGGRPAAVVPGPTSLGATQLVSSDAPARPATTAALARHRSAVRFNAELRAAAMRRSGWRGAAAVRRGERWAAWRDALIRHDAAVAHNAALRAAAAARHRAAAEAAARRAGRRSAVGVATWYGWHPNQCASPFLPHGTLLTVTDLATHKTIQCLVTDTEAHNPGRVVDLSASCFAELAPLSQGVILVRITW